MCIVCGVDGFLWLKFCCRPHTHTHTHNERTRDGGWDIATGRAFPVREQRTARNVKLNWSHRPTDFPPELGIAQRWCVASSAIYELRGRECAQRSAVPGARSREQRVQAARVCVCVCECGCWWGSHIYHRRLSLEGWVRVMSNTPDDTFRWAWRDICCSIHWAGPAALSLWIALISFYEPR